jgi:cytochrome c biogenesis protein CcmG, thiol:disulfide interchange protein DsbE
MRPASAHAGLAEVDPVTVPDSETSDVASPLPILPIPLIRRGHRSWLLVGVVTVVLVGLLGLFGYGLIKASTFAGIGINSVGEVGRIQAGPAVDFQLPLFPGGTFRLSEYRGKVVLVNFWGSWCVPCRDEAPTLERAWQAYRNRDVMLVGIDVWDSDQEARAFLREFSISYPNGPDVNAAAINYGVTGVPETFFIRPDGTVARRWIGPLTDTQIDAFIDDILR